MRRLMVIPLLAALGAFGVGCSISGTGQTGGTDAGAIGPAGGRLTGPTIAGLPGEPRVMVTVPAGQLTQSLNFRLAQVSDDLTPALATGTPVGSAFSLSATGAGAPASLAEITWLFTFSFGELTAAQVPDARRDALSRYLWDEADRSWERIAASLSRSGTDRTSVFATFAASTNCTVRVGLPPDSLAPAISSLTAESLAVPRGGSVALTCVAADPAGGSVAYQWLADEGTIDGSGATATWTTGDDYGPATITCIARNEEGAVSAEDIVLVSSWPDPTPASLAGGVCVFCFDDANTGDSYAFDYMYGNYGMKATCFLQSDRLGTVRAASLPSYRAMSAAGWQLGNHTVNGIPFDQQTGTAAARIAAAVDPAQLAIQQRLALDGAPQVFAAPMGTWGVGATEEAAMAQALLGVFPTIRGTYSTYYGFPLQHLNSVHNRTGEVTGWLDAFSVSSGAPLSLTLARHLIDLAVANDGLAVLHTHNITDSPTRYDLTGADFRALIDYIHASGARTVTFAELYDLRAAWPDSVLVADGDFSRMAALWPALGSAWPNPVDYPDVDLGTLYYPYQPSTYAAGAVAIDTAQGHGAAGSVRLTAQGSGEVYLHQRLALEPSTAYRASAWVRTEGVSGGTGAYLGSLGIESSELEAPAGGLTGTNGWTYVEGTFVSGPVGGLLEDADLQITLDATAGSAWFDDIQVIPAA